MSILSGLVESEVEQSIRPPHPAANEWVVRNAWGLILAGSLAFWAGLGALLVWG